MLFQTGTQENVIPVQTDFTVTVMSVLHLHWINPSLGWHRTSQSLLQFNSSQLYF